MIGQFAVDRMARDAVPRLLGCEPGRDVEQAQPRDAGSGPTRRRAGRRSACRASGSRRRLPERRAPVRRSASATIRSARPTRRSQSRSRTVVLVPGRMTRSGRPQLGAARDVADPHAGDARQRPEVGRVAQARAAARPPRRGRPVHPRTSAPVAVSSRPSESSWSIWRSVRKGRTPSTGTPVRARSASRPGSSSAASPRNLLIRNPTTRARSSGAEELPGTDELGEDAAALDVGDEYDGRVRVPGHPQVGQVVLGQVDLDRAAGAFEDDPVEASREPVVGGGHAGPEPVLGRVVVAGRHHADRRPLERRPARRRPSA